MNCLFLGLPCKYLPSDCSDDGISILTDCCGIQSGYRHHRFVSDTLDTSWSVHWDMVTAKPIDYLFISRADCLDNVDSITLEYSDDNIIYNTILTLSPLDLVGPLEQDIFETFTETTARHWRLTVNYFVATRTIFSKIYIDKLVDFGVMPEVGMEETRRSDSSRTRYTTSGKSVVSSNYRPTYRYTVEWKGLAKDDILVDFKRRISYRYNRFVVLASLDTVGALNSHTIINGRITSAILETTKDGLHTVRLTIEEMLG